ncbi:MAG: N-6 DNA methylase [Rickettsiales bacterium]|nr:N-6 DNA methylase [Rickettsiales bacterium]
MKNLFSKNQIEAKLKLYQIDSKIIEKAREIATRWLNNVDLTKETENQESFLREFFIDILGYQAIAGKTNNSLWWESGSIVDGKKPDGILGFNLNSYKSDSLTEKVGDIRVVIELKDSSVNLDKKQQRKDYGGTPVEQGFRYASKVGGKCEFVIIANFSEIRLYKSSDQSKFHSFKLEDLANDDNKIKEFHFLLSKDRLFTKNQNQSPVHNLDTTAKGEDIEKKFYKHYSTLREEIWHNLLDLNAEKHYGRNFYLYKAQKLIDRIIFIRFCKENGALDNDAVIQALDQKFIKGKYNRMKHLFTAMNEGNPEIGIAKFNGGLFAEDKDLDCLNISDEIIDKIVILYSYDFGSDLDVNILGHIFEQSISDLENLTGDNEKKRKKDGVFYTPAYITEYIVKEAVGGWLADRKAEITAKEGSKEWWLEYTEKLKSIKILDPACGSGAFLVKVFDYLQNEWQEVSEEIKTEIKAEIKTGFNEAFIIDTKTKEELCLADPKSAEIIRPVLGGQNTGHYSHEWAGLWVINTHNGYKKTLSNNSPPHNFNEGESNGLMPFGGGSKKLATNSSLNSSKNIIDPSSASPTSWLCDPPL